MINKFWLNGIHYDRSYRSKQRHVEAVITYERDQPRFLKLSLYYRWRSVQKVCQVVILMKVGI